MDSAERLHGEDKKNSHANEYFALLLSHTDMSPLLHRWKKVVNAGNVLLMVWNQGSLKVTVRATAKYLNQTSSV
jgi:hypothetical protein